MEDKTHLNGLTEEQIEAVFSNSQHLFISAGPGSGKTRVLTTRVFEKVVLPLIKQLRNGSLHSKKVDFPTIWVITFTNKAATELKDRLNLLISKEVGGVNPTKDMNNYLDNYNLKKYLYVGTFHSLGYRLIMRFGPKYFNVKNFTILDTNDCKKSIELVIDGLKNRINNIGISALTFSQFKVKEFMTYVNKHKQSFRISSKNIKVLKDPFDFYKHSHFEMIVEEELNNSKYNIKENNELIRLNCLIYKEYLLFMRKSNQLDFDDLLQWSIYLINLLIYYPILDRDDVPKLKINHLFVDEFQDTNSLQLNFLKTIYSYTRLNLLDQFSVTAVGDPDQSIFGWRNFLPLTEKEDNNNINGIINLDEDINLFDLIEPNPTKQFGWDIILLTLNFRSPKTIITLSDQIIKYDTSRLSRLASDHSLDLKFNKNSDNEHPKVSIVGYLTDNEEAKAIGKEILDLKQKALSSGIQLDYSDISILVRAVHQAKPITDQLSRLGIPFKGVGGLGLWERKIVKDILAYLRIFKNPSDVPAFLRALNAPPRKVGKLGESAIVQLIGPDLTLTDMLMKANEKNFVVDGATAEEKLNWKRVRGSTGIKSMYQVMTCFQELRNASSFNLVDLIYKILDISGLNKLNDENDIENDEPLEMDSDGEEINPIDSLLEYAKRIDDPNLSNDDEFQDYLDNDSGSNIIDLTNQDETLANETKLYDLVDQLLEAAGLNHSDSKHDNQKKGNGIVKVSTLHSAKGLEWPIVFIAGVQEGTLPHFRSSTQKQIDEEARLLYVGMTRSQYLLYITWAKEKSGSNSYYYKSKSSEISRFLTNIQQQFYTQNKPKLTKSLWLNFSKFLNRSISNFNSNVINLIDNDNDFNTIDDDDENNNNNNINYNYKNKNSIDKNSAQLPGFHYVASLINSKTFSTNQIKPSIPDQPFLTQFSHQPIIISGSSNQSEASSKRSKSNTSITRIKKNRDSHY